MLQTLIPYFSDTNPRLRTLWFITEFSEQFCGMAIASIHSLQMKKRGLERSSKLLKLHRYWVSKAGLGLHHMVLPSVTLTGNDLLKLELKCKKFTWLDCQKESTDPMRKLWHWYDFSLQESFILSNKFSSFPQWCFLGNK